MATKVKLTWKRNREAVLDACLATMIENVAYAELDEECAAMWRIAEHYVCMSFYGAPDAKMAQQMLLRARARFESDLHKRGVAAKAQFQTFSDYE